jgi:glycosyltransferase involved in cell wall biosynthesis
VRVLALGHTAELGGAEIGFTQLARHLAADLRVLLLADGPLVGRLRATGRPVAVHDLDDALTLRSRDAHAVARHARALGALRRVILDEVERHGADVVLLNTHRVTRLAAACALPARVRCVTMLRDGLRPPHLTGREALVSQAAVNLASTAVVANSGWTRRQLVTRRPTSVLPPFMDAALFDMPPAPAGDSDALRVLLLGRMAHWKGQLLGLQALAACRPGRRLRVTVAGGAWFGEHRQEERVRRFVRENPQLDVDLPGHVHDVVALIDRHDVLLHTSLLPEPFGQVVVQGMARGAVVVAADRGGPAEVITSGWDGLLYRMGSRTDLMRAVERVAADPELRAAMCANALRTAQRYHPQRTAARLGAILGRVLERVG